MARLVPAASRVSAWLCLSATACALDAGGTPGSAGPPDAAGVDAVGRLGDASEDRGTGMSDVGNGSDSGHGRPHDAGAPGDVGTDWAVVEAAAPCTSACSVGDPCDSGAQCSSLLCSEASCAACSPTCSTGAACKEGTDCASGYCVGGSCATAPDCATLHGATPTLGNGAYPIQPVGSSAPFQAFCDMTDQEGGWTLVLKMGSTSTTGTFAFANAIWTDDTMLNPASTDMSQTEAKLQAYGAVPFKAILAMMAPLGVTSMPTQLVMVVSDAASLEHLIATAAPNTVTTTMGAAAWDSLTVPAAMLQPNCNHEGINVSFDQGCNGAEVRIGLIGNNENDCCSPNSYLGFGGGLVDDTNCDAASFSAGSMEGVGCTGGPMNIADFGYVFVR